MFLTSIVIYVADAADIKCGSSIDTTNKTSGPVNLPSDLKANQTCDITFLLPDSKAVYFILDSLVLPEGAALNFNNASISKKGSKILELDYTNSKNRK